MALSIQCRLGSRHYTGHWWRWPRGTWRANHMKTCHGQEICRHGVTWSQHVAKRCIHQVFIAAFAGPRFCLRICILVVAALFLDTSHVSIPTQFQNIHKSYKIIHNTIIRIYEMPFLHGFGVHVPSDLPSTSVCPDPGRSGCTTAEAHAWLHAANGKCFFEKTKETDEGQMKYSANFSQRRMFFGRVDVRAQDVQLFCSRHIQHFIRHAESCRLRVDQDWKSSIWDDLRNNTNFQMFLSVAAEGCGVELNSAQPPPVKRT